MARDNNYDQTSYSSLSEIDERKEQLLIELRKDNEQIGKLWGSLFRKPDPLMAKTPSKRIAGLVSSSAGALDMVFLVWKLYRKFKGKR